MHSPLVDSSVDNVLFQTSTSHFEFTYIPKQRPKNLLLHNTAKYCQIDCDQGCWGLHEIY